MPFHRLAPSSLRTQIALTFGVSVLLLVVALSIVLGHLLSTTIRADASRSLQTVANNAQRVLAEGLHQRLMIVERLADSDTLWAHGLDSPNVVAALSQQQRVRNSLAWLGVADVRGTVRASTGNLLLGADVSARPWFAGGLQKSHVGDVHQAKLLASLLPAAASGEPLRFVDFAAPVRIDGKVAGVLGLHGSWDWARTVLESLLPDDANERSMQLYIFDRDGAAIYVPPNAGLALGASFPAIREAASRTADVVSWPDGTDYLTSVTRLQPKDPAADLGWLVVARMPKDVAFAPVRAAVTTVVVAGAIAAALSILMSMYLARRISRPLSDMAHAAHGVATGKAGARIARQNDSLEVAGLSSSLIAMTEELESRVRERTTQLENANAELERVARIDPLTGLLNRRGFEEQRAIVVAGARRRDTPLSVIAIDIDHFKAVNDRFGHAVGDRVLQLLATTMRGRFRESDVLARMGGEEFTVILVDTPVERARLVADALVRHVANHPIPEVGPITVSCGVSSMRVADGGLAALKRADRALYAAKADGRNRAVLIETTIEA